MRNGVWGDNKGDGKGTIIILLNMNSASNERTLIGHIEYQNTKLRESPQDTRLLLSHSHSIYHHHLSLPIPLLCHRRTLPCMCRDVTAQMAYELSSKCVFCCIPGCKVSVRARLILRGQGVWESLHLTIQGDVSSRRIPSQPHS
jgi:hypothetical protein